MYINVELIYNNTYKFTQFTYKVPKLLVNKTSEGAIVEVLFRNKKYLAVVVEIEVAKPNNHKINEILKVVNILSKDQLYFLKILAAANFLNIGILMSEFFNIDKYLKQEKIDTNIYKQLRLNSLIENISNNHSNIFVTSSLESCVNIFNKLSNTGMNIDFVQKTGGKDEIKDFLESNQNFNNIIILSNNFNQFNVSSDYLFHFYDTNNISYNLPKLNGINIVEVALYKNMIFGGNFNFYYDFPSLDLFNNIEDFEKIDIDNEITYIYGNNLEECLNIFNNKYNNDSISPFTYLDIIKERLRNINFTDSLDNKKTDSLIIFNPKISFNKTLNSLRLISLLKQLKYCHINNIEVIIFSTKELNLIEEMSKKNIIKMATKEIEERKLYGPNIKIKIFSFSTNKQIPKNSFKDYILGPRKKENIFEYEIRLILSKKINYNEIMQLFSFSNIFNPIKNRNI